MNKILSFIAFLIATVPFFTGCNKVLLHGRDKGMEPVTKVFKYGADETYKAARSALARLGYKIEKEDQDKGTIRSGWRPTKASSHYVDLFDRKDYGTVGAYYHIELSIRDVSGKSEVEISAPVRSLITGRMRSDHSEERKIFSKMGDLLRKDDFDMTNLGVDE